MTIRGNHLKLPSLKGGWAEDDQAMANDNKKTGTLQPTTGLSLRAGGRGFSPATKRVALGYFYWKIEEK